MNIHQRKIRISISWFKSDDVILRKGYVDGAPVLEIAKTLGRTKSSILGRARKLDLRHASLMAPQVLEECNRRFISALERSHAA